jgi:hypothetical protein
MDELEFRKRRKLLCASERVIFFLDTRYEMYTSWDASRSRMDAVLDSKKLYLIIYRSNNLIFVYLL